MAIVLVRNPIYQQLNAALRELIRNEYADGQKFLTEREIGARFEVSRATANKALSNLVSEGVLEFRKGIGTFVQGGVLDYDVRSLVSFTDKARTAGKRPSTRLITFASTTAGEAATEVRAALDVKADEPLFYVERLRLADGLPVILERRHVIARYSPLKKSDLTGSLYAAWTEKHGLAIDGADETIRAVSIRSADARLLGVARGAAGLLVISTGYLSGGRPLWHENTLYRGDAYEFRSRLSGLRPARSAVGVLYDSRSRS
jgi:GntR family transcriptional regulator